MNTDHLVRTVGDILESARLLIYQIYSEKISEGMLLEGHYSRRYALRTVLYEL